MREVEDLQLENIRNGLREAQRYLNTSLGGALVALLVVITGQSAGVIGVDLPATMAWGVTLVVFWVAGFLSATTLRRVNRMLVVMENAPTVIAATMQLPVLITTPGRWLRYLIGETWYSRSNFLRRWSGE